ncbi:MAG: EVE domain-containing protein [Burkholderiales bacterium]|nr:MAG: EVE domain-containing protein [Burkholderiales bacterium]
MTAAVSSPPTAPNFWLMKGEPDECSIDDLARLPNQTVPWTGVRNHQARNFMREMRLGDLAFFYHSSCPEPGIAGIVQISRLAYPDATQFDPQSKYFDAKSKPEAPRWEHVDVQLVRKLPLISLATLRETPALADLTILQRGNRLSITPVDPVHWDQVLQLVATN